MNALSTLLAQRVGAGSGVNAHKCYQCKRCTAGCPVAEFGDLHPAQIMRAVQLGQVERAVETRFIWLCTGCQTCSTRCPQDIDVAAVMDELRMIARERGLVRKDAPFANILKLNLDSMKRWGRLYEVELVMLDRITRPASLLEDLPTSLKLVAKGKINPLPRFGDIPQMRRMARTARRIDEARELRRAPIGDTEADARLAEEGVR